jgi:hypothetical protein
MCRNLLAMSCDTFLQALIDRPGQSQDERIPRELDPGFARIDDRSGADLMKQARILAKKLNYYACHPDFPSSDWSSFFPTDDDAALLTRNDGNVPPHLGLLASFLRLYEYPQAELNKLTERHLDFHYRRILGFQPRPAEADHAHLVCELKKGVKPLVLTPEHLFSTGKDDQGRAWLYRPVRETFVSHARIAALHSVFCDANGPHFAPIANSTDGLGTPLDPAQPQWNAFGHAALPLAPLGFAIASPVLRMREGQRTVELTFKLNKLSPTTTTQDLSGVFQAYISGEKGWLGPYGIECTETTETSGQSFTLSFELKADDGAVVDYQPAVHGLSYTAVAPVVQLMLRPEAATRYAALSALKIDSIEVHVEVTGLSASLTLENDYGPLNPKKAFQPFGALPVRGSRFMIGSDEAFNKHLRRLSISLTWQGMPGDLGKWYVNYDHQEPLVKNGVSASLIYQERNGGPPWQSEVNLTKGESPFTLSATVPPITTQTGSDCYLSALNHGGSAFSRQLGKRLQLTSLMLQRATAGTPPAVRPGFVTFTLQNDFLHGDYRRELIAHAVGRDKIVLNEPYTPVVQHLSLDYEAQTTADLTGINEDKFVGSADVQFFHIGAFGQRREHAFLRNALSWADKQPISLLPVYPDEGEFLIGLSGVNAGAAVSLLLQVAEDSADPDLPAQKVNWSVLCDNHWRPFSGDELALDTTRSLRASGLLGVALPSRTTTDNTWFPSGLVWLKGIITEGSRAACQLLEVIANAIEVRCELPEDVTRSAHIVPPRKITRMSTAPADLKQVSQPYASTGGRAAESDEQLRCRAAERLRHRQRCVTAWDYERLLLEAFPEIHRIKCIPHASKNSWMAPGYVMLVVIPDLRRYGSRANLLCPKVDIDTLARIQETASRHCGPQIHVLVKNPDYCAIRLDFKVRFTAGLPFEHYRQQLHEAIVRSLSPWAFESGRQLQFGGKFYRSVLLDFVESLPYVDFVTDFSFGLADNGSGLDDVDELSADLPDTILVSTEHHSIAEIVEGDG